MNILNFILVIIAFLVSVCPTIQYLSFVIHANKESLIAAEKYQLFILAIPTPLLFVILFRWYSVFPNIVVVIMMLIVTRILKERYPGTDERIVVD